MREASCQHWVVHLVLCQSQPATPLSTDICTTVNIAQVGVIQWKSLTKIWIYPPQHLISLGERHYKKLSYRRETALQGALVLAKSGRMGVGDDILQTLYYRSVFNHCDIIGLQSYRICWKKKHKIRAIRIPRSCCVTQIFDCIETVLFVTHFS